MRMIEKIFSRKKVQTPLSDEEISKKVDEFIKRHNLTEEEIEGHFCGRDSEIMKMSVHLATVKKLRNTTGY